MDKYQEESYKKHWCSIGVRRWQHLCYFILRQSEKLNFKLPTNKISSLFTTAKCTDSLPTKPTNGLKGLFLADSKKCSFLHIIAELYVLKLNANS